MYSRKYIGTALPDTSHHVLSARGAALAKNGRETSLPPDYTGTAFADPDLPRQKHRQDFPETVIPMRQPELPDEPIPPEKPDETELPPPVLAEEPLLESPCDEELPSPDPEPAPQSPPPPMPSEEGERMEEAPPLVTAEWLRSLTLEDLMLYWMLLMLLTCSREDQIYLLLGILLLGR